MKPIRESIELDWSGEHMTPNKAQPRKQDAASHSPHENGDHCPSCFNAGYDSGQISVRTDADKLAEALRDCITEQGAMSDRSHYNAKRRLQYISDLAKTTLAAYEAAQ